MIKRWQNRLRNRRLNNMKKRMKMFDAQESLANIMLMYLFSDSNYPSVPEYDSGFFSVYIDTKNGQKLVEDPALLN